MFEVELHCDTLDVGTIRHDGGSAQEISHTSHNGFDTELTPRQLLNLARILDEVGRRDPMALCMKTYEEFWERFKRWEGLEIYESSARAHLDRNNSSHHSVSPDATCTSGS
ncbi:hypothetical protein VNI00_003808 [Paramarasmius palmivorus]|uniref:Uncharacterized protein n=1 Tax=Paramarasmius palmivorus TaxID=297713 RepID=A0AAW0DLB7_9AGAR